MGGAELTGDHLAGLAKSTPRSRAASCKNDCEEARRRTRRHVGLAAPSPRGAAAPNDVASGALAITRRRARRFGASRAVSTTAMARRRDSALDVAAANDGRRSRRAASALSRSAEQGGRADAHDPLRFRRPRRPSRCARRPAPRRSARRVRCRSPSVSLRKLGLRMPVLLTRAPNSRRACSRSTSATTSRPPRGSRSRGPRRSGRLLRGRDDLALEVAPAGVPAAARLGEVGARACAAPRRRRPRRSRARRGARARAPAVHCPRAASGARANLPFSSSETASAARSAVTPACSRGYAPRGRDVVAQTRVARVILEQVVPVEESHGRVERRDDRARAALEDRAVVRKLLPAGP